MSSGQTRGAKKRKDTKGEVKVTIGNKRPQSSKPAPKQSEKEKSLNDQIEEECKLDPVQIMEKLKISEETLINMLTEENAKLRLELKKYAPVDSEISNNDKKLQDEIKKLKADHKASLMQKDTEITKLNKQIKEMTDMTKVRVKETAGVSSSESHETDTKEHTNVGCREKNQTEVQIGEKQQQISKLKNDVEHLNAENENRKKLLLEAESKLKECQKECNQLKLEKATQNQISKEQRQTDQHKHDPTKLQSQTSEIETLKETEQKLRKQLESFEENKKKLQSAEQKLTDQRGNIESLTTEKAKVQEELKNLKEEILELREKFKLKETQEEGMKNSSTKSDTGTKTVDELQKKMEEIKELKNSLTTAQSEIDRLKRENEAHEKKATDQNKTNEQEIKRLKEENKKIKEESDMAIKQLQKENSNKEVKHSDKTNAGTNNLQEKLKKAQDEIDELKNRLSKVVGAKLMTDNPNITDLSDENRPTKLSEKYSELYDNEWTDAYEEAENEFKTEEKGIEHLYKTLLDVFDFCKKKSVEHENNIRSCVMSLPNSPNPKSKSPEISVTNQRQLKEIRKSFAPMLVESVFQNYLKEKKLNLSKKENTEKFIRKSVEICWLMNSQDPPVIIDSTVVTGKPFDADKYRTYTKAGKVVDYVVWPPMLLHKNGPMLCKGVAQGK